MILLDLEFAHCGIIKHGVAVVLQKKYPIQNVPLQKADERLFSNL